MDLINDGVLWQHIMDALRYTGVEIWADDSEILIDKEDAAEAIADFLTALGLDVHTGYYDPEEDERSGETDDHTGYWYIDLD